MIFIRYKKVYDEKKFGNRPFSRIFGSEPAKRASFASLRRGPAKQSPPHPFCLLFAAFLLCTILHCIIERRRDVTVS
jgi:hypothetical protein